MIGGEGKSYRIGYTEGLFSWMVRMINHDLIARYFNCIADDITKKLDFLHRAA